ncbi:MAG: nickel-binding protein [Pseudomonadota bacterium]
MIARSQRRLTDIYVECRHSGSSRTVHAIARDAEPCLALHRVQWLKTLESTDSARLLCHFRAPDAESVRLALRRLGIRFDVLWVDRRRSRLGPKRLSR